MMVFGSKESWIIMRWFPHDGINVLIKRKRDMRVLSPPCENTARRQPSPNLYKTLSPDTYLPGTFVLDFTASRTDRYKYLLFKPLSP